MTSEKNETFIERFSQLIRRLAIWPTLFAAIILLLVFYQSFLITGGEAAPPCAPLSSFIYPDMLPIWDVQSAGGMPVWGNPENIAQLNVLDSLVYTILKPLFSFLTDMSFLFLMLNFLVLSGATYAFARRHDLSPLSSSLASFLVLFVPPYVASVLNGSWQSVLAFCLMPVILLAAKYLTERKNLLWFCVTAFFYAWQLLRASATVTLLTTALILIFYLQDLIKGFLARTIREALSGGALLVAALVTGFLAASYIYAPSLEFWRYAQPAFHFQAISLTDLLLLLLPSFNGEPLQHAPFVALYVGVITLLFAGFSVLLDRSLSTWLLLSAVILSLIAAFVGLAEQAVLALAFLVLLLAARGLDSLLSLPLKEKSWRRLDIYMVIVFSFFAAVLALFLLYRTEFMKHILRTIPLLTISQQHHYYANVLIESVLAFALVGTTFLVIRLYLKRMLGSGFLSLIILLLALLDLLLVDYKIENKNSTSPLPDEITSIMKQDPSQFRIFSTLDSSVDFPSVKTNGIAPLTLMRDLHAESGFNEPDVMGMRNPFFSKYTRLVSRFGEIVEEPVPVQYIRPERLHFDRVLLNLLNVKYILCHSPIYDPLYKTLSDSTIYMYENIAVLPRVFLVDSVAVLPGKRAIFDALHRPDFEPTQLMFLEQSPPFAVSHNDSNHVELLSYSGRDIVIQADIKTNAALLMSEVFYPAGWKAFANDKRIPIYKANYFLRSVFLPPGEYNVRFHFEPVLFTIGWWVSLITLVLLIIGMIAGAIKAILASKDRQEATA